MITVTQSEADGLWYWHLKARNGKIIAENVVGYSVSVLAQSEDSLRGTLRRLSGTIPITPTQVEQAVRRYRRAPTRPTKSSPACRRSAAAAMPPDPRTPRAPVAGS